VLLQGREISLERDGIAPKGDRRELRKVGRRIRAVGFRAEQAPGALRLEPGVHLESRVHLQDPVIDRNPGEILDDLMKGHPLLQAFKEGAEFPFAMQKRGFRLFAARDVLGHSQDPKRRAAFPSGQDHVPAAQPAGLSSPVAHPIFQDSDLLVFGL
jgi:hypothetical protein